MRVFQHLDRVTVEKVAMSGTVVTTILDLEASRALCGAKTLGGFVSQIDDLGKAGNVIVPFAHPQVGSYIESFEIDVTV